MLVKGVWEDGRECLTQGAVAQRFTDRGLWVTARNMGTKRGVWPVVWKSSSAKMARRSLIAKARPTPA